MHKICHYTTDTIKDYTTYLFTAKQSNNKDKVAKYTC